MTRDTSAIPLAGPGIMLLSAALFGYFGFMMAYPELDVQTGQLIPLVVTLKWTVRAAAIGFLIAAIGAMAMPRLGNIIYALVGVLSAIMFIVVLIWDLGSKWDSGFTRSCWPSSPHGTGSVLSCSCAASSRRP